MARSGMRIVKRPRLEPNQSLKAIRTELIRELTPIARIHEIEREKVTKKWQPENRPDFQAKITVSAKAVGLTVLITNGGEVINRYGTTIRKLWAFINLGTRPHIIEPFHASILRFTVTRRAFLFFRRTNVVYTKRVKHPGTKAQKHNERINKKLDGPLRKAIQRGYRRGFRKALR